MSMSDIGKDFLEHYGVKGMRWGVRRTKKAIQRSADAERHAQARKKNLSELSDKELRDLANRLNTEQQVKRLTSTAQGKSAAARVLATVGTVNAGIAALKSPAGVAAISAGAALATRLLRTSKAVSTIGQF